MNKANSPFFQRGGLAGSLYGFFYLTYKFLGRFECRDAMSGNDDGGVLGNVTAGFFSSLFDDKASKATQVYIFAFLKGVLHGIHEGFNGCLYSDFFNASLVGDFRYNFSFGHSYYFLVIRKLHSFLLLIGAAKITFLLLIENKLFIFTSINQVVNTLSLSPPMHFSQRLLWWYHQNGRPLPWRETKDPYAIWISEIILQQTRVDQGLGYYLRFMEAYPDVHSLARAPLDELLRLWQGLGYYSRARNLHQAALQLVEEHGGKLPQSFQGWLQVKGVGPYTAAAIASIAFNEAVPALDGNVFRVLARLFAIEHGFETAAEKAAFRSLAQDLMDAEHSGDFNQAMMDFGALVCKPAAPDCASCPFNRECLALARDKVTQFPVRKKKAAPRLRYFNYFLFFLKGEKTFPVQQRGSGDIWEKLYELPLIGNPWSGFSRSTDGTPPVEDMVCRREKKSDFINNPST
jgi:A/G-specific adenine glycosylase